MTQSIEALAVYGETLYASSGQAVYRSDDKGGSWTIVSDGAHGTVSTLLAVNEDTVFVGTSNGVFRTMDGGDSWMERNTGITNASVSKLEVIGDKIYAGHDSRVVHSIDGGKIVAFCRKVVSTDELRRYRVSRFRQRTLHSSLWNISSVIQMKS